MATAVATAVPPEAVAIPGAQSHTDNMTTNVGNGRLFSTLLVVALAGVLVQIYRSFLLVPQFRVFALRVVTLFVEALPFLLAGALIAAVAREILPARRLLHVTRRYPRLGLPAITLLGLLFPVGEHRLSKLAEDFRSSGIPTPHIVVALLTIPLFNPVVIVATAAAFPENYALILIRLLGGLGIAIAAGALLSTWMQPEAGESSSSPGPAIPPDPRGGNPGPVARIDRVVQDSLTQFLVLTRYYLVAAVIIGLVQSVTVPPALAAMRGSLIPATLVAIGLAYLLAAPGVSDAFIARGLLSVLPVAALPGFLIVGPVFNLRSLPVFSQFLRGGHLVLLHLAIFSLALAVVLATVVLG